MSPAWTVRVGLARDGAATCRTRAHGLTVGQPLDFGADAPGPSSFETVLAALGSDLLLRFADLCGRRRLLLDQVEARVRGRLGNPLVTLGVVGEEGDPGLAEACVTLSVTSPAPEPDLRAAFAETVRRSPLAATFARAAALTLEIQIL